MLAGGRGAATDAEGKARTGRGQVSEEVMVFSSPGDRNNGAWRGWRRQSSRVVASLGDTKLAW